MSIYATLWRLKFPRYGTDHTGCEWVEILAQGVPAHVGTPTAGFGYEAGDPYAAFLPPAVEVDAGDDGRALRAVVIVTGGTPKGTRRSGQEYVDPLLVLSGHEYGAISFRELHELRGNSGSATYASSTRWPVGRVKPSESWQSDISDGTS